jgi:cation transport regulator ChaC
MSVNTIAINRQMRRFDDHASVWLFGYGSIIFKADFPTWNAGQPTSPAGRGDSGKARTITAAPPRHRAGSSPWCLKRADCAGMAYLITPEVFAHLDHREKNGYLRLATAMRFEDGETAEGLIYIAAEDNEAFAGPASELEIARQIAGAVGPAGATANTCSSWPRPCATWAPKTATSSPSNGTCCS